MVPPQVRQPTRSVPPSHHLPLPSHSHKVSSFLPPRNTFQLPHHIIALMETSSLRQCFQFFPPQNTYQLPHHIIALMETFSLTQGFQFFPPRNTFQLPHHIIALMETFSLTQGFQNTSQHEIDNYSIISSPQLLQTR